MPIWSTWTQIYANYRWQLVSMLASKYTMSYMSQEEKYLNSGDSNFSQYCSVKVYKYLILLHAISHSLQRYNNFFSYFFFFFLRMLVCLFLLFRKPFVLMKQSIQQSYFKKNFMIESALGLQQLTVQWIESFFENYFQLTVRCQELYLISSSFSRIVSNRQLF